MVTQQKARLKWKVREIPIKKPYNIMNFDYGLSLIDTWPNRYSVYIPHNGGWTPHSS